MRLWKCTFVFDSELGQINKLRWYLQLPCFKLSIKGTDSVANMPASLLVVPLEKALSGVPYLRLRVGLKGRSPVTPKRARYNALIVFS